MFDLTCSYLDDDDIDHEAEKQWIFKTLHRFEKEEEILEEEISDIVVEEGEKAPSEEIIIDLEDK